MSAKTLAFIAALVLAVGAVAGFVPVSSQGANCGSAFVKSDDAYGADLGAALLGETGDASQGCTDLRSLVRIPAVAFLVAGGILLIASGVASGRQHRATQSGH